MYRKVIAPIIGLLSIALFFMAQPAYAGGWATVGVTEMPDQPQAQQPFKIAFTVWQHGNKPVHEISWDGNSRLALTPQITFTSADTGQTVSFAAEPSKQPGRFAAEVVLPSEGTWEWSIALEPLQNVTELQPLTVLPDEAPAVQTMPAQAALFGKNIPLFAVLAAIVLLVLFLLAARLRVTEQTG